MNYEKWQVFELPEAFGRDGTSSLGKGCRFRGACPSPIPIVLIHLICDPSFFEALKCLGPIYRLLFLVSVCFHNLSSLPILPVPIHIFQSLDLSHRVNIFRILLVLALIKKSVFESDTIAKCSCIGISSKVTKTLKVSARFHSKLCTPFYDPVLMES